MATRRSGAAGSAAILGAASGFATSLSEEVSLGSAAWIAGIVGVLTFGVIWLVVPFAEDRKEAIEPRPAGPFGLTDREKQILTPAQRSFLAGVADFTGGFDENVLPASDCHAGVEPEWDSRRGGFVSTGILWLLIDRPHSAESITLGIGSGGGVIGGWDDPHYIWDTGRKPVFETRFDGEEIGPALASALDWLRVEIARGEPPPRRRRR